MLKNKREIAALMLLDVLRAHLLRSRFTVKAYDTEVTPLQAYLLLSLEQDTNVALSSLAEDLGLHKSSISRNINALKELGYLQSNDSKLLTLSTKAKSFLQIQERFNRQQTEELSSHLNNSEIKQLSRYMHSFAFGSLSAPREATAQSPSDVIFYSFRKLTKLHGVLGDNYLESSYSVSDWLIWSEIYYQKRKASDLAEMLGVNNNSINQILRRYRNEGVLTAQSDSDDKRANTLSLAAQGIEKLRQIELCAIKLFLTQLASLKDDDLQTFVVLLVKYIGGYPLLRATFLDDTLILAAADPATDIEALRWGLLSFLQTKKAAKYPLGASLFNPANAIFAIFDGSSIVGGIEISEEHGSEGQVLNFFCGTSGIDKKVISASLEKVRPKETVLLWALWDN